MSRFTDPQYLKTDQYKDSSNLDARVVIHQRFSTNSYGWMNWVFDHLLVLPADAKILELGCGPGYLWKENAARIPSTWDITLSDLSAGMVDSAWRNLVVTGRTYKFKEIDAQSIPYPDGTFNLVIANHMLYHVASRDLAIANISRVLCSGGRLVCATNGPGHMRDLDELLAEFEPAYRGMHAMSSSFNLENGEEQLRPHFALVELVMYPSDLWVTDAAMLAAYAYSTPLVKATISRARQQDMMDFFQQRIAQDGGIAIRKQTGLFLASKPLD